MFISKTWLKTLCWQWHSLRSVAHGHHQMLAFSCCLFVCLSAQSLVFNKWNASSHPSHHTVFYKWCVMLWLMNCSMSSPYFFLTMILVEVDLGFIQSKNIFQNCVGLFNTLQITLDPFIYFNFFFACPVWQCSNENCCLKAKKCSRDKEKGHAIRLTSQGAWELQSTSTYSQYLTVCGIKYETHIWC